MSTMSQEERSSASQQTFSMDPLPACCFQEDEFASVQRFSFGLVLSKRTGMKKLSSSTALCFEPNCQFFLTWGKRIKEENWVHLLVFLIRYPHLVIIIRSSYFPFISPPPLSPLSSFYCSRNHSWRKTCVITSFFLLSHSSFSFMFFESSFTSWIALTRVFFALPSVLPLYHSLSSSLSLSLSPSFLLSSAIKFSVISVDARK